MESRSFRSIISRDIHPLESAMLDAIVNGDHEEVLTLIPLIEKRAAQSAADKHHPSFAYATGETGFTFLHCALEHRRNEIANDLLTYYLTLRTKPAWAERHLDPIWIVAKPRKHVLSLAAQAGFNDIVCTLIANAESCRFYFTDTVTTSDDISPFEINAEFQPPLIDIVEYCSDTTLQTALDFIAKLPLPTRILDQTNNFGQTALHAACLNGNAEKAELLLRYGASSTIAANDQKLPLQCVAEDKKIAFTDYLTQSGVFIRNNQPPVSINFQDADQTQRILAHGKLALTSATRDTAKQAMQQFYYPFTFQLQLKKGLIAKLETDSDFIEKVIQLVRAQKITFNLPRALQSELPLFVKAGEGCHPASFETALRASSGCSRDQDANLEGVLAKNHQDLTALIEQLTEIDTTCADLIKQRFEFMRSGEFVGASLAIAALIVIFCFALQLLIYLFSTDMTINGGFFGFITYLTSLMLCLMSPLAIGFLGFDIYHILNNDLVINDHYEPFRVAKLILENLFRTEGRYHLPLSQYSDIHKQLQLLTEDLVTLLSAYRVAIQNDPTDVNAGELRKIITELKDDRLALTSTPPTVKSVITCLQQIDSHTTQRDKKPIRWDFFKKPSLKSAQESDDTVTLVRSDMQAVVVI